MEWVENFMSKCHSAYRRWVVGVDGALTDSVGRLGRRAKDVVDLVVHLGARQEVLRVEDADTAALQVTSRAGAGSGRGSSGPECWHCTSLVLLVLATTAFGSVTILSRSAFAAYPGRFLVDANAV